MTKEEVIIACKLYNSFMDVIKELQSTNRTVNAATLLLLVDSNNSIGINSNEEVLKNYEEASYLYQTLLPTLEIEL